MKEQTVVNLIIAAFILLIIFAGAGYWYGHKTGVRAGLAQADQSGSSQSTSLQSASQLPAVTPIETLRNFLGNFFFDSNFVSNGYQQSPSLTPNMISIATTNQNRQVTVYKTFMCTEGLPATISFSAQPLDPNTTSATVTATETLQDKKTVSPSYSLTLADGRWKIDSVNCPQ
ncbi:MAG TPA: hypothetical protein VFB03_02100 [Candidatus Saccharimonadales bacterium]|nr:hypothetical protein [Candidatus Saccharimonadales bacterium]